MLVDRTLPLLPLLPFLGFLLNGLVGKRLPRAAVSVIGCGLPAIAFGLALLAFGRVAGGAEAVEATLGDWIRVGDLRVRFGFAFDRLSGVMVLVVTGVGTLIHVYATGYMREDPGYARFFAYLNLFLGAMLVLVLADNLVLLFLGWEGVGLCSYLLIGFWYKDLANANAAIKAFVVNRIGDFGFLLGIFLVFVTFGALDFEGVNRAATAAAETQPPVHGAALFWIALLLFVGATGKSAQIPLFVWLPDAMAGPTPVSALIHAATMVTSGVYLLARLAPLYMASGFLPVVAVVGVLTALLAALIAPSQTDIKKVLAYSTISQLGYMFFAAGVGAFGVAVFHLVTHAFFKALLFLGAGAVIHSLHHEQDMRRMGGLWRKLPRTGIVFLAGALALAGFPFTSGFFSKDAILHEAFGQGWFVLVLIAYVTAIITAFYTFRQFALVFLGEHRGGDGAHAGEREAEIHESPVSMMVPLYVLAALALLGGFLAVPEFLDLGVSPVGHEGAVLVGWLLGGLGSVAGIAVALELFVRRPEIRLRALATAAGQTLSRLSANAFYVDALYDRLVVKPFSFACQALFWLVDRLLIDWILVEGAGLLARVLGLGLRAVQTGRIDAYALYFVLGVLGLLTMILLSAS